MILLQVTKEMTDFFPAVLKFGITGLSAIVFLLAYFLLRTQNKRDRPNGSMLKTIKSFMWIALVFSILSATSSFVEGYYIKKAIASDTEKTERTEILASTATEKISSYYSKIKEAHRYENNTVEKGTVTKGEQQVSKTAENQNGLTNTDNKIESRDDNVEPELTESRLQQQMSEKELNFRILRQAIFRNIYSLGGDKTILEIVLERVKIREDVDTEIIDRIKNSFSSLLVEKYKWIKNDVYPMMNSQKDTGKSSKQDEKSNSYSVRLPKSVWIFDDYPSGNVPTSLLSPYIDHEVVSEYEMLKKIIK